MIYITGDVHADFTKFSTKRFPEQKHITKKDFVIVCGDFGIWEDNSSERYWLDWLEKKNFTILFVDGNHSNFDRLYSKEFPIINYHGGKAHKIRDNIFHLMRGYIFKLEGKTFFTFGGAQSHDIQDGILRLQDYKSLSDLVKDYNSRTRQGQMLRIEHLSWWKQELPSKKEMDRGIKNLEKNNFKVDYVITHCPPHEVCKWCGYYDTDKLIDYFDEILSRGLNFIQWWSGHLHKNQYGIYTKYNIVYHDFIRIV